MANITLDVARTVGKHFVSLSCVQRMPDNETRKLLVFSGFVIDVQGEWFFVTAGHTLRRIAAALAAGSTFDIWRLGDQTAASPQNAAGIPFAFVQDEWIVVEDEDAGLDYAATPLSFLYRKSLEAGGVIAIGRNAWSNHEAPYDHWLILGIPSESVNYDGKNIITAKVVLIPLISTEAPSLAGRKSLNQFYARPSAESDKHFNDADGLSGGPVFMLKKENGEWRYFVIGVQSGWYQSTRILAICPFDSFGRAIDDVLQRVYQSNEPE